MSTKMLSLQPSFLPILMGYPNITKNPFSPIDYEELIAPQNHAESIVFNENNIFAFIVSLGYDSSKLVRRNDN